MLTIRLCNKSSGGGYGLIQLNLNPSDKTEQEWKEWLKPFFYDSINKIEIYEKRPIGDWWIKPTYIILKEE